MRVLRVSWRLFALIKLTALFYLLLLLGALVTLPFPGLAVRSRNFCFRNWSRALLAVMNGRLERRGTVPEPPFFLVSNHLGYIDILVLASQLDPVFIAKADVSRWPIMGHLCRAVGTLFVDRGSRRDLPRVIAETDRILARGQGLVLFPEGTSTRGAEVGRFHPALLEAAARAQIPVSYATLGYRTAAGAPPAHLAVCWWGDMPFGSHLLELLALPGFTATLTFGAERIREQDRKRLATRLWQAVDRQFVPVVTAAAETA